MVASWLILKGAGTEESLGDKVRLLLHVCLRHAYLKDLGDPFKAGGAQLLCATSFKRVLEIIRIKGETRFKWAGNLWAQSKEFIVPGGSIAFSSK